MTSAPAATTTSFAPPIYRREALSKLFTVGYDVDDHILFGTDGMTPSYGVQWSVDWQRRDDAIYASLGLAERQIDGVYRGAFQRLLFGSGAARRVPGQLG